MAKRIPVRILLGAGVLAMLASVLFSHGDEEGSGESSTAIRSQRLQIGHPTFVSPHASPIAVHGNRVFVVNTPSDTLDVLDTTSRELVARINVGVDPVSVAVRPDGKEVWVANHVSDSVSVIDNHPESPTYLQITATVQEFDENKATRFDEPVGIAFANNEKAYVALSSENQIAVIDTATHAVTKRLHIASQDPRAIAVRGDKLYVLPFESNNQTQLSGGKKEDIDGDLVTFDAYQHSVFNNSILSLGHVVDLIKHPKVPDRDLYVFDTRSDELLQTINTLGTLLYGLTVDSAGDVYIAQTDARNDSNGRAGTKKHGLAELENRAFLNRITRVGLATGDAGTSFIDLEPLPPEDPERHEALATPFGIQISADDSTLVATAAGSNKLFTVDAQSGEVLGRVAVDAVPRGVALANAADGSLAEAWVYNAVENTVSVVDVADPRKPSLVATVPLEDPTHPTIKRGRKAFETASASTTGTFSCASCHPDAHTDQLLWVLNTPHVTGGDQIQPRVAMPVRGLRDTAPFHWDGIPGDPYGGLNAANIDGADPPNADETDQTTSTRHLIDGSLANTMLRVGADTVNDEGKAGLLSAAERDDLAQFILNVPYPPAPRRPYDNVVTGRAHDGFRLFHIEGDTLTGQAQREVCGDCHRFPHLVSTNHPSTGMDAPTWRGAYDRFLILPQGRANIIEFDPFVALAAKGIPEREMWRVSWQNRESFDPVWDMVLEGSTGYSGSFARQWTLNEASATDDRTDDLLSALEKSAAEGAVVLVGDGVFLNDAQPQAVTLRYDAGAPRPGYVVDGSERTHTRQELVTLAKNGHFVGTLTAHHGVKADFASPQPAIWALGPIHEQRGPQQFPRLHADQPSMTISGRYLEDDAYVLVNGRRVAGDVSLRGDETLTVELSELPPVGMHLLQLQNPGGMLSNDFIFHVTAKAPPEAPPNLGDLFYAADGKRLLGTWVDVGTRGEGIRVIFSWKIQDHLLDMTLRDKRGATVALIRLDHESNEIVHSATNYAGTALSGTWDFEAEGGPQLDARFTSSEGAGGDLMMQFRLDDEDDDAMVLAIQLAEQAVSNINMVRGGDR